MEVKGYFPIPVWKEKIIIKDDWKKFAFEYFDKNSMLTNNENKNLKHSLSLYSNTDKDKKLSWGNILDMPELKVLRDIIKKTIEKCFVEYYGDLNEGNEAILRESWLNKCDKDGTQYRHNHGNSLLSYTLYLNYDFQKGHAPLYFERPSYNSHQFFSVLSWTKWTAARNILYEIMEGDLLVWPSQLVHGYFRNNGDNRITISGNALLKKIYNKGYSLEINEGNE